MHTRVCVCVCVCVASVCRDNTLSLLIRECLHGLGTDLMVKAYNLLDTVDPENAEVSTPLAPVAVVVRDRSHRH